MILKVLVFGTFDGLHEGHKDMLRQAKNAGDFLVVVVARDSTVKKNKNKVPKYSEEERLNMVRNYELVDEALMGSEGHNPSSDRYVLIEKIQPDIVCLGYDQAQFAEKLKKELEEMDLKKTKVKILKPYKPDIYHSSLLNK